MVDRSSLPMDSIEFISTSWRPAAPKRPHLPWLVVVQPVDDGVSAIESHNVFFALLNSLGIFLHNPFTGFTVRLPNLNRRMLIGCRLGDTSWISLSFLSNYTFFEDIIFDTARFYAVSGLRVYVCLTGARHARAIAILPTNPSISVFRAQKKYERKGIQSYLVASPGDLLLASISYGAYNEEIKCDVFRVDLDSGQLRLIKLKNLGGRALFLEDKSMSISTAASARCKGNCIYYGCCVYKTIPRSRWRSKNGYPRKIPQGASIKMCQNISIFNMKDRKTSAIPSLLDHCCGLHWHTQSL